MDNIIESSEVILTIEAELINQLKISISKIGLIEPIQTIISEGDLIEISYIDRDCTKFTTVVGVIRNIWKDMDINNSLIPSATKFSIGLDCSKDYNTDLRTISVNYVRAITILTNLPDVEKNVYLTKEETVRLISWQSV